MQLFSENLFIGCAGWSIAKVNAELFPSGGSHLERYAQGFNAVEINSSFYKPHRPQTYSRWGASTPDHFRFSVKVPKAITHEARLQNTSGLADFAFQVAALEVKLGPWLVQLPPSLDFDSDIARKFFQVARELYPGPIVCEPRHRSWFTAAAEELLLQARVARVAADPALCADAARPGGWGGIQYYRLHGSPRVYYSAYEDDFLKRIADEIAAAVRSQTPVWCIFDNTAAFAAAPDAVKLIGFLRGRLQG